MIATLESLAKALRVDPSMLREIAKRAGAGEFYRPFDRLKRKDAIAHKFEGTRAEIPRMRAHPQLWRHIDQPVGELKALQRSINSKLISTHVFPDEMFGGISGRSIIGNASVHIGQPEIATLDITDCFGSITHKAVYRAWTRFGVSPDVARLLTQVTTREGRVPQGAPTSPALANLVLEPIVLEIRRIVSRRNLRFSIFVDDVVLSGKDAALAIDEVIHLFSRNGFEVARSKTHQRRGSGRVVTSVAVRDGAIRVHGKRFDAIHATIIDALSRPVVSEATVRSIAGQIAHVRSISPPQADALKRVADGLYDLPVGDIGEERVGDVTCDCNDGGWHRRARRRSRDERQFRTASSIDPISQDCARAANVEDGLV